MFLVCVAAGSVNASYRCINKKSVRAISRAHCIPLVSFSRVNFVFHVFCRQSYVERVGFHFVFLILVSVRKIFEENVKKFEHFEFSLLRKKEANNDWLPVLNYRLQRINMVYLIGCVILSPDYFIKLCAVFFHRSNFLLVCRLPPRLYKLISHLLNVLLHISSCFLLFSPFSILASLRESPASWQEQ